MSEPELRAGRAEQQELPIPMASRRCNDHTGVDINDDNINDASASYDASDDDETYGMETVAIGTSASTPVSAPAAAVHVGAAAAVEAETDKETAMRNEGASMSMSAAALPSSSEEAHQQQYQYHHHQQQQQQQSYHAVPSNPPAATAKTSMPMSISSTTSAALSPLDQTAAARAERRRLFLQRTSQTARRVWDRINPNLQLCLCQTVSNGCQAARGRIHLYSLG